MEELFPLESSWVVALAAGAIALVMLLRLARSLPGQNLIVIAAGLMAGEALTDWLMLKYRLNPVELEGPVWTFVAGAALLWLAVVLCCRRLAQFIVEPWRREKYIGLWVLGISALFTAGFQFGWPCFRTFFDLDPMDTDKAAIMAGIRGLGTVVLLGALTPWLIQKRPVSRARKSKLAQQPENKAQ